MFLQCFFVIPADHCDSIEQKTFAFLQLQIDVFVLQVKLVLSSKCLTEAIANSVCSKQATRAFISGEAFRASAQARRIRLVCGRSSLRWTRARAAESNDATWKKCCSNRWVFRIRGESDVVVYKRRWGNSTEWKSHELVVPFKTGSTIHYSFPLTLIADLSGIQRYRPTCSGPYRYLHIKQGRKKKMC